MIGEQLAEFVDQRGHRFSLDTSLRVVVDGQVGYLEGSAHTHPGRMHVYIPDLGHDVTCSLSQIESMSDAARAWITGFLTGSEPHITEYLGVDERDLENGTTPDWTEEDHERWQAFTARFRRTGTHPSLNRRPVTPLVITDDERSELRIDGELRPWARAGERVWVPDGRRWVQADPQPELVNGQLAGTLCAERGHPDLNRLDSGWEICLDCGEVSPPE